MLLVCILGFDSPLNGTDRTDRNTEIHSETQRNLTTIATHTRTPNIHIIAWFRVWAILRQNPPTGHFSSRVWDKT